MLKWGKSPNFVYKRNCIRHNKENLKGIWDLPVLKQRVLCWVTLEYLGNNDNLNVTYILCLGVNFTFKKTERSNNFFEYHLINKNLFKRSTLIKFSALTFLLKARCCIKKQFNDQSHLVQCLMSKKLKQNRQTSNLCLWLV